MAAPENTLISRAEVTSITTPATNRKALVLDGATIELGDTGIRDLSGTFDAGKVASGQVLVQRVGNVITWQFVNVTLSAGATHPWTIMSNADGRLTPFLPEYGSQATVALSAGGATARIIVPPSGNIAVHYGAAATAYLAIITFVTNRAWPGTLPGVVNGQPVGV